MAANDNDIIIAALRKEREQLHQRVMQLDRIIKRVKDGQYSNNAIAPEVKETKQAQSIDFPQKADLRIQILTVFDIIGKASKLNDIQEKYNALNGNSYPIRDTVRGLQSAKLLVMIKTKSASRGFLWAKSAWVENNQLLDQYKPEGFDILHRPEDLTYI